MSKTMTWNYKGEADITLGEVHVSPLPKILTVIIMSVIVIIGTLSFIFRYNLYDLFVNPHIVLTTDSVDIPYSENFNPIDYISKSSTVKYDDFMTYNSSLYLTDDTNSSYIFNYISTVDTSILGTYIVKYYSSNRVKENEAQLTVNVVDVEKPTLYITQPENVIPLDKIKFSKLDESNALEYAQGIIDLSNYITVVDNYSIKENIQLNYSNPIKGSSNEYIKTFSIDCSAIDENGNISEENNSSITISFKLVVDSTELDEALAALEKEKEELQNQSTTVKPTGGRNNNENNNNPSSNQTPIGFDPNVVCPVCGMYFSSGDECDKHVLSEHGANGY